MVGVLLAGFRRPAKTAMPVGCVVAVVIALFAREMDPAANAASAIQGPVGDGAGNMITVHNVVAASATVGHVGRGGDLIRKTTLPTIYS